MTEISESERRQLVTSALAVADRRENAERVRIPWRSAEIYATVVELPVDKVLLNPNSHRIRAQLESSTDRPLVQEDPLGNESQRVIADLLREAKEFKDLKANLQDVGQIEPGVVTADGVLVNANTRCVALRDIRQGYVRAAVLPADATQEEIDRLELRLQMKADFKSDYTFTNELLFIEDLVKEYRLTPEEIAVEMGWASRADPKNLMRKAEQAKSYLRMLSLIRELQHMSDDRLPIIAFDANYQALLELDDEYEKRKRSDYEEARELRDARLVGLLVGAGYRELREIDHQFVEKHLVAAMEDRSSLRAYIETLTRPVQDDPAEDPAGLDLLAQFMPAQDDNRRSAGPMLDLLLGSIGKHKISLTAEQPIEIDRNYFCSELLLAVNGAATDVRFEREAGDLLNRPLELVRKATKHVRAALEALSEVKDNPEFEADRIGTALVELATAQAELQQRLSKDDDA
jgi:hypothetical protein